MRKLHYVLRKRLRLSQPEEMGHYIIGYGIVRWPNDSILETSPTDPLKVERTYRIHG